ncbi:hypothetical protein [Streptacidiphilus sp. PAMC 29251]
MSRTKGLVLRLGLVLAAVLAIAAVALADRAGHKDPGCAAGLCTVGPSAAARVNDSPEPVVTGHLPAHGGCASPGACGWPDAHSTGPRIGLKPHRTGALSIATDGAVISGWDITGSLDIYANNVTVIDSRITSTNWWGINLRKGFSGLRVLHTTIVGVPGKGLDNGGEDYAVSNMGGSSVEVGWNDISGYGDMLSMGRATCTTTTCTTCPRSGTSAASGSTPTP